MKTREKAQEPAKRRRSWPKRIATAVVCLLLLCGIGFGAYVSDYYHANAAAEELSTAEAPIIETDSTITVGLPSSEGIVFYPGAKVDPAAYVPLMQDLASHGFYCVIAKMPFNLAFFDINAADNIIAEHAETTWWIAGHSLGGAMAAQYAASHSESLEGIALLGAYAASDLSETNLQALVIYGSEDNVLNREKLTANEGNLPPSAKTAVLEGGNHADFGDYGPQDGDGEATLSPKLQRQQTADLIAAACTNPNARLT